MFYNISKPSCQRKVFIVPTPPPSPPTSQQPHPLIILWTAPRSLSTAFERTFISHPTTHVLHEPLSIPYHFGPERLCPRFPQSSSETYNSTVDSITTLIHSLPNEKTKAIFIKELAYCLTESSGGTKTGDGILDSYHLDKLSEIVTHHTFIIRHPARQIPSLYRQMRKSHPDFILNSDILHAESGVPQLYQLYKYVLSRTNNNKGPVIVDADDITSHPRDILQHYCVKTGIEFCEEMLRWDAGVMPQEWKVWGERGWHDVVVRSTGIGKVERQPEVIEVPGWVGDVVKRCEGVYWEMWERRIRV